MHISANVLNVSCMLFLGIDECKLAVQCYHGGKCFDKKIGFGCRCEDGYEGELCESK